VVAVTESAFAALAALLEELGQPGGGVRLYVQAGPDVEPEFGFEFGAGPPQADDLVLENDGVRLMLDPMAAVLLEDSVIDIEESADGLEFVIEPQRPGPNGYYPDRG
jgi:iron-sulfur cluster insertion protein